MGLLIGAAPWSLGIAGVTSETSATPKLNEQQPDATRSSQGREAAVKCPARAALSLGRYAIFDKSIVTTPDANFGTSSTTFFHCAVSAACFSCSALSK